MGEDAPGVLRDPVYGAIYDDVLRHGADAPPETIAEELSPLAIRVYEDLRGERDAVVDARKNITDGVRMLRARSVEELFDIAMALSVLKPPRGKRTVVITNSGGPGVLAADALTDYNVDLVDFQPETVARLAPLYPPEASIRNPLDIIASANA
jgi:hypothetical protein